MRWKGFFLMLMLLMFLTAPSDQGKEGEAAVSGTAEVPWEASGEAGKYIALTFDDGPRADTTGRLLDGLRDRGAAATFFFDRAADSRKRRFGAPYGGGGTSGRKPYL